MRSLIYVPVVHTELDMGSLAERLEACYRARYGAGKWNEHLRTIHEMWQGIEDRLMTLKIHWNRVKVYQDGLPVCDKEEQIVRDVARQGSLNHRLVAQLLDRGATLVGTESPELLLREYRLVKSQLDRGCPTGPAVPSPFAGEGQRERSERGVRGKGEPLPLPPPARGGENNAGGDGESSARANLEERDRFVARRIQDTLAESETGLLFMGLAHEVHRYLPHDIQVRFLIPWLPFRPDFGRQSTRGRTGKTNGRAPAQAKLHTHEERQHERRC